MFYEYIAKHLEPLINAVAVFYGGLGGNAIFLRLFRRRRVFPGCLLKTQRGPVMPAPIRFVHLKGPLWGPVRAFI
jgi:hypothetical protein